MLPRTESTRSSAYCGPRFCLDSNNLGTRSAGVTYEHLGTTGLLPRKRSWAGQEPPGSGNSPRESPLGCPRAVLLRSSLAQAFPKAHLQQRGSCTSTRCHITVPKPPQCSGTGSGGPAEHLPQQLLRTTVASSTAPHLVQLLTSAMVAHSCFEGFGLWVSDRSSGSEGLWSLGGTGGGGSKAAPVQTSNDANRPFHGAGLNRGCLLHCWEPAEALVL